MRFSLKLEYFLQFLPVLLNLSINMYILMIALNFHYFQTSFEILIPYKPNKSNPLEYQILF